MTLPAHVPLAMGRHIHTRDLLNDLWWPHCPRSVTPATDSAGSGFTGAAHSRMDLVLRLGLVANRAIEQSVMGNRLGSGDMAVAGGTLFGCPGRFGLVRAVAVNTRLPRIVNYRINLRKATGPGRVVTMTQRAIAPLIGRRKANLQGIFRVGRARSMAYLTGHAGVSAGAVSFQNIFVAHATGLASGVLDLVRGNGIYCCRSVMTDVAEGLGDQEMTRGYQTQNHHTKSDR